MNPEQHAILHQTLLAFRHDFHAALETACQAMTKDVESWRAVIETRFQQKFAQAEELMSGPYNRDLAWDWVEDGRDFGEISDFIRERRVRLRDDPSLEISAVEYFEKYARGNLSVLKILQDAGYFTPPPNKFFQGFCKQLFSGAKSLLRTEDVKKVDVPPNQVDLAFLRAQELIARDEELQRYCPAGAPILRLDKEYYLHVVNSLRGLPYAVVQPLSDEEQKTAASLRQAVAGAEKTLSQCKPALEKLVQVARLVGEVAPIDSELVERFWTMYEQLQQELTATEVMETDG